MGKQIQLLQLSHLETWVSDVVLHPSMHSEVKPIREVLSAHLADLILVAMVNALVVTSIL